MDQIKPVPKNESSSSISGQAVREHLRRITSSSVLAGSNRLIRFLEFVVEQKLGGNEDAIQEYVLGLEVFDRKESFDPRIDSIVRVEARRLRKKLAHYYRSEGAQDTIRIELPDRGYVPRFSARQNAAQFRWTSRLIAAAAAISCIAFGAYYLPGLFPTEPGNARAETSIGVLPFGNHSAQAELDFLSEGFTDKLITDLARIHELRVISHASMKRFGNGQYSSQEIALALNLKYLVEGGILRSGERMRVTVQLIDAEQDRHLWATDYERDSKDVIEVQRALARDIVREIAVKLTPDEEHSIGAGATASREAYEAYLKGKFAWNQWTEDGAARAIEYFSEAIRLDPNFALAYSWLAAAHRQSFAMGDMFDKHVLAKSMRAAERGVALGPDLGFTHFSLGVNQAYAWQWERTREALLQATKLDPGLSEPHHGYAIFCLAPMGRLDEAEAAIRRALRLDPVSLNNKVILGKILYFAGKYEEAAAELREALALDPNYSDALRNLGAVNVQLGKYDQAIRMYREAQSLTSISWGTGLLAHALAAAGQPAEARKLLDELILQSGNVPVSALGIATAYTGLGERDAAFEWLDHAFQSRELRMAFLGVDPIYEPLRGDSRFHGILHKIGLE